MEDAKSTDEDDQFLDASDEFPFYDCPESLNSSIDDSPSSSQSTLSLSSFPNSNVSKHGLRRRRSLGFRNLKRVEEDSNELDSELVDTTAKNVVNGGNEDEKESSVVTDVEKSEVSAQLLERERERVRENDDEGNSSLLVYLCEFIVKAIGFQINLLISFVSFPFWVLYYCCMFAFNPLFVVGICRSYLMGKLRKVCKHVGDILSPYTSELLNEHKLLMNLVSRWGWGLFWSVYVGAILVTLLISAFVIGGVVMRYYVVEEPFELKQGLNFDYTKAKPAAFVPIVYCPSAECEVKDEGVNAAGLIRVIPPKHKLQATVTMVLPESNYNRNLGIFQVRVEFLSENGRSLASFSHPCMLEFKSLPLRLLMTFFKIVPLVAGYLSETQTLNLKFRGYSEGVIPTSCLKITMEQRAEFRPGAGIPEIYDAFVHLKSELPFFKRILWYWRKTIFVWFSMTVFAVELLFALVCCRPAIFPSARPRSDTNRSNTPVPTHTVQN